MAKRSKRKAANSTSLVLIIVSVLTAVGALVGLACKFINVKGTVIGFSNTKQLGLSEWFDVINDWQGYDEVSGWEIARCMLIVTAVLLTIMVVSLIVKMFTKLRLLKWLTLGLSIAVIACSAIFMITTFIGCGALSGNIDVVATGVEYSASVGVFVLGIGALVSAICATVVAVRK